MSPQRTVLVALLIATRALTAFAEAGADTPASAVFVLGPAAVSGGPAEAFWLAARFAGADKGAGFIDGRLGDGRLGSGRNDEGRAGSAFDFEPGEAFWRGGEHPAMRGEYVGALVIVLSDGFEAGGRVLESAARGAQAPYRAVKAFLDAAGERGLALEWSAAAAALTRFGLSPATSPLLPWLREGYAALGLALGSPPATGEAHDLAAAAIAAGVELRGLRGRGEDFQTNYLVLPFVGGVLGEAFLVRLSLGLFAAAAFALALAPHGHGSALPAGGRSSGPLREALASALISTLAFGAVALGGRLAAAAAGVGLPPDPAELSRSRLVALSAARTLGFLGTYYALSGFMARASALGHATRAMAAKAAALYFMILGLISLPLAPPAAPLALSLAVGSLLGAAAGVLSGLALASTLVALAYLAAPLFLGRYASLSAQFLYGDAAVLAGVALCIAPFALWVGASVSGRRSMRRGARAAVFFAFAPLASGLLEFAAHLLL